MARKTSWNPIGFTAIPVSVIIVTVYIALFSGLLYVHHVVPAAPKKDSPARGINITEAWGDLQELSNGFHPYNSRRNDEVRDWLLLRIDDILSGNGVEYTTEDYPAREAADEPSPVVVFNDLSSNITFPLTNGDGSAYFESTNVIVYVRGKEDDRDDWWRRNLEGRQRPAGTTRAVLVNAHYDSVSTGYGATDDGVGIVSILQLIKYYTTKGNQPNRGLVALFNNGEEDWLYGSKVFAQHPISRLPDVFLNLEGAGAGGRAVLFRSTDNEVTKMYKNVPYPFGSVTSADGFKRGLVRSGTDYSIFTDDLGLRGLDVAFMEPRARYHTEEDSARQTNKASLWHMLSAALATTRGFTSDTKTQYPSDRGSATVWFDVLGRGFGILELHTLFAISVTLLVAAPVTLILLAYILSRQDRYYLFAGKTTSDPRDPLTPDDEVPIHFKGWRGILRFPLAFGFASAAVVGLAFLLTKLNPMIVYSSQYAVWSMMLSAWFAIAWFFLRGADFMRPTALQRAHSLGWLFFLFWLLLVADTVGEQNFTIASGYPFVIYFAAVFFALAISYLELFALPKKSIYAQIVSRMDDGTSVFSEDRTLARTSGGVSNSRDRRAGSSKRPRSSDENDATETTSLLSKATSSRARPYIASQDEREDVDHHTVRELKEPYGEEQPWSGQLPSWLWILQFLAMAPIVIILLGQVGLLLTSALHQTPADGNPVMTIYLAIAILSIFILLPTTPFLHRFSSRIPTLLFLVFIATLIYNLLAFPFSAENRLKVYFVQEVDLDTGINTVSLTGVDGYLQDIIKSLPSANGQPIKCTAAINGKRKGLQTCSWEGLPPNVVPAKSQHGNPPLAPPFRYASWMTVNATRYKNASSTAQISISGRNTRACKLVFKSPITNLAVKGAGPTAPLPLHADTQTDHQDESETSPSTTSNLSSTKPKPETSPKKETELRLWSRNWSKTWTATITWDATTATTLSESNNENKTTSKPTGLDGAVVCLWSDVNERGVIPALDEVKRFMPVWSTVTKLTDGLVEGRKGFMV